MSQEQTPAPPTRGTLGRRTGKRIYPAYPEPRRKDGKRIIKGLIIELIYSENLPLPSFPKRGIIPPLQREVGGGFYKEC